MSTEEIVGLTKTLYDTLLAAGLTKSELAMSVGLLNARVNTLLTSATQVNNDKPEPVKETPKVIPPPVVNKSIHYDAYDPAPPMTPDPLPPPIEVNPTRILAKTGQPCVCSNCAKVIYSVNRDIYEGCKVGDFVESFTAMPGCPKFDRSFKISNVNGVITTACPACGGDFSLYLTERRT